jgi:hypothetical protein
LFSLPVGTEMFHFPTFPPPVLYIQTRATGHNSSQVSPFGHPRITARLPTPRGLSQAPTTFIGSRCQGIHHAPLAACHHQEQTKNNTNNKRCSRPLCRSQTTHQPTQPTRRQPTPPPHPYQGQSQTTGGTTHRATGTQRGLIPQDPTTRHPTDNTTTSNQLLTSCTAAP